MRINLAKVLRFRHPDANVAYSYHQGKVFTPGVESLVLVQHKGHPITLFTGPGSMLPLRPMRAYGSHPLLFQQNVNIQGGLTSTAAGSFRSTPLQKSNLGTIQN